MNWEREASSFWWAVLNAFAFRASSFFLFYLISCACVRDVLRILRVKCFVVFFFFFALVLKRCYVFLKIAAVPCVCASSCVCVVRDAYCVFLCSVCAVFVVLRFLFDRPVGSTGREPECGRGPKHGNVKTAFFMCFV